MKFFKPKFFDLAELLDPKTFDELSDSYRAWLIFDERILRAADCLRSIYGPAEINTWANNGLYKYRGYRPMDCKEGAFMSDHKFGRALDLKFKQISAEEIRQEIIKKPDHDARRFITCIEKGSSWLHISCRNTDGELILI